MFRFTTGYALHVFPRAINPPPRRSSNQTKTYTYRKRPAVAS